MGETEHEQPEQEPDETPTPPETLPDEEEAEDDGDPNADDEVIARVRDAAPPPDAAKEQRRVEQALKREQKRHAERIEAALGPAHEHALPCPLCFEGFQGWVFPGDGENLRPDQREAAFMFLGLGAEPTLEPAEGVVMCDRCDGWGKLAYPTKVENLLDQPCGRCGGLGYRPVDGQPAQEVAAIQLAPAALPNANGGNAACPVCGQAGMAGQPHYCAPQPAGVS